MLHKQLSVSDTADTTWGIEYCSLTNEADGLSLGVAPQSRHLKEINTYCCLHFQGDGGRSTERRSRDIRDFISTGTGQGTQFLPLTLHCVSQTHAWQHEN